MNKNSFLIYLDYEEQFDLLSDEEIGILMRAIIKYEKTKEIPQLEGMAKMAFSFIKTQLDRDREKYNKKCEKNKENGARGGRPKKENEKPNGFEKSEGLFQEPKKPDNDNEDEEDNDNENDFKEKTKKKFKKPTIEEIEEYCKQRNNKIDPHHFYDYYQSNGWKVGKNSMKDWQASIRTWERKDKKNTSAEEEFLSG